MKAILSLSSQAFERGMKGARRVTGRFGRDILRVSRGVRRFGGRLAALAGVGGVAGIGFLIKRQIDLLDQLAKTSSKLGIQTDQLIGLRRAATLTGVAVRTFDMGLQRFARRLAEAFIGTGEAQGALRELGIDAKALVLLPLQRQLFAIADAMNKVTDQSQRIRLGFKLFDSEGVALINTMALGSEGLREVINETRRLGLTFSRLDLRRLETLRDTMSDIAAAIGAATSQMAFQLVPVLDAVATAFGGVGNIAQDTQTFVRGIADAARTTAITVALLMDRATARFLEMEANLRETSQFFLFGEADEASKKLVANLRAQAAAIRAGQGDFVTALLEGMEQSINRIGDKITRFGIQRTVIPDLTGAVLGGGLGRPRAQLALASELGIVGGQARFGVGGGVQSAAKKIENKFDTANMRLLNIYKAIKEQSPLRVGP